jgi:metallo-beta-lactamase class B
MFISWHGQSGSYLITTPQGHILVNTDFEDTVPVIRSAVEKLGFKFTDIKIILQYAHGDHMEGDAMVKELTAARVMAMEQDVPALKRSCPAANRTCGSRTARWRRGQAGRLGTDGAPDRGPHERLHHHVVDEGDRGRQTTTW